MDWFKEDGVLREMNFVGPGKSLGCTLSDRALVECECRVAPN